MSEAEQLDVAAIQRRRLALLLACSLVRMEATHPDLSADSSGPHVLVGAERLAREDIPALLAALAQVQGKLLDAEAKLSLGSIPLLVHLEKLENHLAQVQAERDRYHAALLDIRERCGAVCDDFVECTHRACRSSAHARIVAGDALS
jgi:hypothetical protein